MVQTTLGILAVLCCLWVVKGCKQPDQHEEDTEKSGHSMHDAGADTPENIAQRITGQREAPYDAVDPWKAGKPKKPTGGPPVNPKYSHSVSE